MTIHVLPGDSLTKEFTETGLGGDVVVFREALIAGDLSGETLDEFWRVRSAFIEMERAGDPIEYQEKVVFELEKLTDADEDAEVNLWFENELFCQANMWFCLSLLQGRANIYRIFPADIANRDIWNGFREHDAGLLENCFANRVRFSAEDIETGVVLWNAFRDRDAEKLRSLGKYESPAFPMLLRTAEAAAEIETRPAAILRDVIASGMKEFDEVFAEFQKRAGVFGFGDIQVERLLERL